MSSRLLAGPWNARSSSSHWRREVQQTFLHKIKEGAAEWTCRVGEAIDSVVMMLVWLRQKCPIKPFLPPGSQEIIRLAAEFTRFLRAIRDQ